MQLVTDKSRAAVEQFHDMRQQTELLTLELEAVKSTSLSDSARKNAEILALQESLSKAYDANGKAASVLHEVKEINASSRKELIQEYEGKLLEMRSETAASSSVKRQLDKAKASMEALEARCGAAEHKNIELEGALQSSKTDLAAQENLNQTLKDVIKKMTNEANRNDFADTFEEVMREEMMAMKGAFEAKLKIAREQTEAMSRKRQSEINRIEGKER